MAAVSRAALVKTPRSGAKPLPGSPGAPTGPLPAAPAAAPAASPTPRKPRTRTPGGIAPAAPGSQAGQPGQQQPAAQQQGTQQQQGQGQQGQGQQQHTPRLTSIGNTVSSEGSGAFLALFAWPLLLNLIRGGPAQMWGWVKAKFINEPYTGPGAPAGKRAAGQVVQPIPPHLQGQGPGQHPGPGG